MKSFSDKEKAGKYSAKKNKVMRIRADKSIVSDVLGSYTGTPVNRGFPEDIPDLFPVQDADDL